MTASIFLPCHGIGADICRGTNTGCHRAAGSVWRLLSKFGVSPAGAQGRMAHTSGDLQRHGRHRSGLGVAGVEGRAGPGPDARIPGPV